jgi:hypothetical protein
MHETAFTCLACGQRVDGVGSDERDDCPTALVRISRELLEMIKIRDNLGHALRVERGAPDAYGVYCPTVYTDTVDSLRPLDWKEWPEAKALKAVARTLKYSSSIVPEINRRLERAGLRICIFDHGGFWDVGLLPPSVEDEGLDRLYNHDPLQAGEDDDEG